MKEVERLDILRNFAATLTAGVTVGFLFGLVKYLSRPSYTPRQVEAADKLKRHISSALKFLAAFCLVVGLIWTVYYLVLGVLDPAQAEYATNLSQLIVSVLTVISIIFAFFEFLRR